MKTLSRLQNAGYQVQLDGEEIVCRWLGPGKPDAAQIRPLLEELRQNKEEALRSLKQAQDLPALLGDWPQESLEAFIERAGIMEHDGGLPCGEAECRAEELVRAAFRQTGGRV